MIKDQWDANFKKLLPRYILLNSLIVLSLSLLFVFMFNLRFVFCAIPIFYLISVLVNAFLLFHADSLLSKELGYEFAQRFLWEKWNTAPKMKRLKIFRLPGFDCRIGQLKKVNYKYKGGVE